MNILFLYWWGKLFPYKTKADRRVIYEKMLKNMDFPNSTQGFCIALQNVTLQSWMGKLWKFPELYQYRPWVWWDEKYDMWYDIDECGMKTRKIILKYIINKP